MYGRSNFSIANRNLRQSLIEVSEQRVATQIVNECCGHGAQSRNSRSRIIGTLDSLTSTSGIEHQFSISIERLCTAFACQILIVFIEEAET